MKLIAFAASNSRNSINKKLVCYAASLIENASSEVLNLNDYEIPLFGEDREREIGQPQLAYDFLAKLADCDAILISFAEHNGSYSVAYKNLFDWCSRITPKIFQDKPMIVLATSPGGRGAQTVLEMAVSSLPRFGADVRGSFSLPKFYDSFDVETGKLHEPEQLKRLQAVLAKLDENE
jgi:NAD(P)H-dependent FMN reductase